MNLARMLFGLLACTILPGIATAQVSVTDVERSPGKITATEGLSVSAKLVAIDPASRKLTLEGQGGNRVDLVAGPEVQNFDALAVGDSIHVEYVTQVAIELVKGGGLPVENVQKSTEASAARGETPAAIALEDATAVGDVIALDAATRTVTVRGTKRALSFDVSDPEQFARIAVGDQIRATRTSAIAIAAIPAPAEAKK